MNLNEVNVFHNSFPKSVTTFRLEHYYASNVPGHFNPDLFNRPWPLLSALIQFLFETGHETVKNVNANGHGEWLGTLEGRKSSCLKLFTECFQSRSLHTFSYSKRRFSLKDFFNQFIFSDCNLNKIYTLRQCLFFTSS